MSEQSHSDQTNSPPVDPVAELIGAGSILADIVATGNDAPEPERARALEQWQRTVLRIAADRTNQRREGQEGYPWRDR